MAGQLNLDTRDEPRTSDLRHVLFPCLSEELSYIEICHVTGVVPSKSSNSTNTSQGLHDRCLIGVLFEQMFYTQIF